MPLSAEVRVSQNKDAAGAVRDGTTKALLEAADAGFAKSQEEVPVDQGTLLQSGVPPTVSRDGAVIWGYNAPYAVPVEEGSIPHWAPIEPLKGWARRVLGDESAAYAVQRKIAKKGTPPQPYVKPGIEAMKARLRTRGLKHHIETEL